MAGEAGTIAAAEHTRPAPAAMLGLLERLLADVRRGASPMNDCPPPLPVADYISESRWQRERDVLFRRFPLIVAHITELPENGSCLRHDSLGLPILLTRDAHGAVRAFFNVCRHRGMRMQAESLCRRNTLVCPYHGWTYELDGRLRHVNHGEFFPGLDKRDAGLVELPCAVRHGLVWVVPTPGAKLDLPKWLGSIGADLDYLGFDNFVQYRRVDGEYANNWKLIIDAFLEAYHVKVLHRNSVYPFFLDSMALSEPVDRHMRSVVARRSAADALALPPSQWDLREHCSFTHFIFPNCITINHPDYSSVLTFYPVAPDRMHWTHHMLVPAARHTDAARPHWEKTFQLIHENVFRAEDINAAEQIQAGLACGANTHFTLGRMEHTIDIFHRSVRQALDELEAESP